MPHSHLRRLERIWISNPIFFITTCAADRRSLFSNERIASIFIEEWRSASQRHGWYVGQFVIMPDHVHFFCSAGNESKSLSEFMKYWKEWTSKRIKRECGVAGKIWQREFFDHVMRSEESYAQKKEYVFNNPVRAGLVKNADEWLWKGEIEIL